MQVALEQLRLRSFRNLRELVFEPGPRFNVLGGDNGQGKSNLLEAIDYLGTLRSFRGASSDELIDEHAQGAELLARVRGESLPHQHRVTLTRGGRRQVQLDGKRPRSSAAYARSLPVVLFHPGELTLTTGAPEPRRAFLDRLLERVDETYAAALAAYTRALSSRNRLLKTESPDRHSVQAIKAYDELLASTGTVIGQARAVLLEALAPVASEIFREVSGEGPGITLQYEPRVTPELTALRRALELSFDKDLARGFTAEGPHADEVAVRLEATRARRYASQGQHRAIVLALKVAELLELDKRTGKVPLLLLDDVSSELDKQRNQRFFALLRRIGSQVFLTTTQPELIVVDGERRDFRVEHGTVTAR